MNNSIWNKMKEKYIINRYGKKIVTTALLVSTISIMGYHEYDANTMGLDLVYADNTIEVKSEELNKKNQIGNAIKDDLSYCGIVYAITIDDKEVAYLESEEKAKEIIEEYKNLVTQDMDQDIESITSIEILEDISFSKKRVPIEKMEDIDDLSSTISKLKSGAIEEKKHIIKENDNFWSLSQAHGITMEDMEKANPDKDTRFLNYGDEVIIPISKPLLTVATFEDKKVEEEIEFETEYEIDDELYKDTEEIRVEGQKGKLEKQITIERHNGVEASQEVIKENVLEEPVKEVIAKGTKPIPLGVSTGTFSTPTRGTISSTFGHRWGKLHGGLDIAARIGEPIIAADGGRVTYAQHNDGGYGYMVDIDHGNGYVTRYAHSSKLYVSSGDKVNKGDVIAAVGNTGRSTGPHLHFEVRKDGIQQDPQGYIE